MSSTNIDTMRHFFVFIYFYSMHILSIFPSTYSTSCWNIVTPVRFLLIWLIMVHNAIIIFFSFQYSTNKVNYFACFLTRGKLIEEIQWKFNMKYLNFLFSLNAIWCVKNCISNKVILNKNIYFNNNTIIIIIYGSVLFNGKIW